MFRHILCLDSYDYSLIFARQPIRSIGNFLTVEYLSGGVDILLSDLCFEEDNGRPDLLIILVHYFWNSSGSDASADFATDLCVSI